MQYKIKKYDYTNPIKHDNPLFNFRDDIKGVFDSKDEKDLLNLKIYNFFLKLENFKKINLNSIFYKKEQDKMLREYFVRYIKYLNDNNFFEDNYGFCIVLEDDDNVVYKTSYCPFKNKPLYLKKDDKN